MSNGNDHTHIYDMCEQHMHAYVLLEMKDGMETDGIITGIDHENVYVAVPTGGEGQSGMRNEYSDERQYGYHYGGPSHGGYYGGGYYGRPRRFNRLIVPLAALTAITLLPWY